MHNKVYLDGDILSGIGNELQTFQLLIKGVTFIYIYIYAICLNILKHTCDVILLLKVCIIFR